MNCQNHPEIPATAYCRACGKPVCNECRRDAYGTVFCEEHAPAPAAPPPGPAPQMSAPPQMPPPPIGYVYADVSPALAFLLGWIPGVGAIYNGQYAKGLVHAVIFGLMISILNSNPSDLEPIFGILLAVWIFYMAFEAYHTARRRRMGEQVDEYSSILNLHGRAGEFPVAGVTLIVLGIVLLLHTLGIFELERVARYWPVLLIAAGAYMLYSRYTAPAAPKEFGDERH